MVIPTRLDYVPWTTIGTIKHSKYLLVTKLSLGVAPAIFFAVR